MFTFIVQYLLRTCKHATFYKQILRAPKRCSLFWLKNSILNVWQCVKCGSEFAYLFMHLLDKNSLISWLLDWRKDKNPTRKPTVNNFKVYWWQE